MKIATKYSHLNGLEYLQVHKRRLLAEIESVIKEADASVCRTKVSREVRTKDELLYSPIAMNKAMRDGFARHGWHESRTSYWVTADAKLIRKTMHMNPEQQKKEIEP